MNRTRIITVSVMVMVLMLSVSWAEVADKIGFVNVQKVMITCNAGKKAAEEFKLFFEKHKATIQQSESELKEYMMNLKRNVQR
jgi:Skp family chaperone for outer membrane proteins